MQTPLSGYMWAIVIPVTAVFAYFTNVNIFVLFAIGQGINIFKGVFAHMALRNGSWAKRIV